MKKQAEAWVGFAEKDLLTVSEIIENQNLTNIVTFHCQQAIEKFFKAFILENDKTLLKIHNLLTLYGTIKESIDLELDEDLLSTINDVYLESRYPGEVGLLDDGTMPTTEQANQFFTFAKEVETKIKQKLKYNEEL